MFTKIIDRTSRDLVGIRLKTGRRIKKHSTRSRAEAGNKIFVNLNH